MLLWDEKKKSCRMKHRFSVTGVVGADVGHKDFIHCGLDNSLLFCYIYFIILRYVVKVPGVVAGMTFLVFLFRPVLRSRNCSQF